MRDCNMKKITFLLLMLSTPFILLAQGRGPWHHWGGSFCLGGDGRYGGGIVMLILVIIVLAALGFIVYKQLNPGGSLLLKKETPLEILKSRYARGEITKEEFDQMKNDVS